MNKCRGEDVYRLANGMSPSFRVFGLDNESAKMLCGRDRTAAQPVTPPCDLPGFDLSFAGAGKFGLDVGCKTQLCRPLKKPLVLQLHM
jgi:hypothetical protein